MSEILRQILTGRDNQTHDLGRWLGALSGVAAVFFQGWAVIVQKAPFDMQAFGVGVAALAAGIGAMLKLKEGTEP